MDKKTYLPFARKYRPQTFEEVTGHRVVVTSLKNALRHQRLVHAYIFAGPRGVGKTSLARIFAKAMNCVRSSGEGNPCNQCESCVSITRGQNPDVLEIDAASNRGIDEVRLLEENVRYKTLYAQKKVYILDEAHMMTEAAWNAFLKTLEEPPEHVKFIFATTEPEKLPKTVQSRCQRFDFMALSPQEVEESLTSICQRENIRYEPRVVQRIASLSRGALRDAQVLLEQVVNYAGSCEEESTLSSFLGLLPPALIQTLFEHIQQGDERAVLNHVPELLQHTWNMEALSDQCFEYVGQRLSDGVKNPLASSPEGNEKKPDTLPMWLYFSQILLEFKERLRTVGEPRFLLETTLLKMTLFGRSYHVPQLLNRLEEVLSHLDEKELSSWRSLSDAKVKPSESLKVEKLESPGLPDFPAPRLPNSPAPALALARGEGENRSPKVLEPRQESPTLPEAMAPREGTDEERWQKVRDYIRTSGKVPSGRIIEGHLKEGIFGGVEGETIRIGFKPIHTYHCQWLGDPQRKEILEKVVHQIWSKPLSLRLEMESKNLASVSAEGRSGEGTFPSGAQASSRGGEGGMPKNPFHDFFSPAPLSSEGVSLSTELSAPVKKIVQLFNGTLEKVEKSKSSEVPKPGPSDSSTSGLPNS